LKSIVFITGIPSSGKSAVTKELVALANFVEVVETDVEIRRMDLGANTLFNARNIFRGVLDKIDDLSDSGNVIVDGSPPASYVAEARERFGGRALFVSLRVTDVRRRAREGCRRDRSPIQWNEGMTALQGDPELYDVVIETSNRSARECALEIRDAAMRMDD
jgi:chloramphenicol 3-O-phosphotransferase